MWRSLLLAVAATLLIAACTEEPPIPENPSTAGDRNTETDAGDNGINAVEPDAESPKPDATSNDHQPNADIPQTDTDVPPPDTGDPQPDTASGDEDTSPPEDSGESCDSVSCGSNASCHEGSCHCDSGYTGDPDVECTEPSSCSDGCPSGATCLEEQCICDPGFSASGSDCIAETVSDPATRTESEVCQRWNEDSWTMTFVEWEIEPQDKCDWGVLSEQYHLEALRETTRYRWLVGLPPVTSSANQWRETVQACATTLAAEDAGLTHHIPQDYGCYTDEASTGAQASNLAHNAASAADSVKQFIHDWDTPNLVHRRWLLDPRLATTAFGQRDSYTCNFIGDLTASFSTEFIAYPSPGYFPHQALHGKWSFSSSAVALGANSEVSIERVADGAEVTISDFDYQPEFGGTPPMISWRVGAPPTSGEAHRVTIADADGPGQDLSYEVTLTNCES